MRRALLAAALAPILLAAVPAPHGTAAPERRVHVARLEGTIDQAAAGYVTARIRDAEREGAETLVLVLDTPGGVDASMRQIVKGMVASRVPVVVHVAPAGARAASAGVFLVYAAHVAAMAPGTNLGAAHPVGIGGRLQSTEAEKAASDAAAYLRSLAGLRGRDVGFAEEAVRRSASLTAEEALARGAVDLIAPDLGTLLARIDGRQVSLASGEHTLRTAGAAVVERPMTPRQRLLHALANPNLAYLLMILGFYGILFELASPGMGFGGMGGAVSLILGLYGLQVVGVNYAGLALVLLSFALLVADLFAPTHGVLTAGAVLALLVGSLLVVDARNGLAISLALILPLVGGTALLSILAASAGLRAQRQRVATGAEGMLDQVGVAHSDLTPEGTVLVRGELWQAASEEGSIPAGTQVRVTGLDGLTIRVRTIKEGE